MILRSDAVLVVRIRLDEPPLGVELDEEERARAARFVFERDRRRFVASHTATRAVLGRALTVDPASLRFLIGERGKPRLLDPPIDLRFNLAHSGERALLAVALGREVGVDIEQTRVIDDLLGLAAAVFSPNEQEQLRQTPAGERHDLFFRIWTRKESFIKARGDGISFPLAGFDVSAAPDASQLLLACNASPEDMRRWTMRALQSEVGYTAALTVEGREFEILTATHPA
jgi:4'-phosphopantetheinyl transferase